MHNPETLATLDT